jgi:hypothetical protein
MAQHSEPTEDDALRIWREAGDSIPAKIKAMGGHLRADGRGGR